MTQEKVVFELKKGVTGTRRLLAGQIISGLFALGVLRKEV
jgi:hypothetical protein